MALDRAPISQDAEALILRAQRAATLGQAIAYYGIELEECGPSTNGTRCRIRCPFPSHPKNKENEPKGKNFLVFCDDHGTPYSWKCWSDTCNKHGMVGRNVVTFVALMEGITQQEAARKICDGLLSVPRPSTDPRRD